MLSDKIQEIYEREQKERQFYFEQIKPVLEQVIASENKIIGLLRIQKLLVGTPFESTSLKIDDLEEEINSQNQIFSLKLHKIFDHTMGNNDANRRVEVAELIKSSPLEQLTISALYYASSLYNHGESYDDAEKAHTYAERALSLINESTDPSLSRKTIEQYAFTFDRLALKSTPARPQKFGTTYAGRDDDDLGWKKGALIPPYKDYLYNLSELEQFRQDVGLKSLEEQEIDWGIKPRPDSSVLRPIPSIKSLVKKEQEPSPIICSNCGAEGHFSVACIIPKK